MLGVPCSDVGVSDRVNHCAPGVGVPLFVILFRQLVLQVAYLCGRCGDVARPPNSQDTPFGLFWGCMKSTCICRVAVGALWGCQAARKLKDEQKGKQRGKPKGKPRGKPKRR